MCGIFTTLRGITLISRRPATGASLRERVSGVPRALTAPIRIRARQPLMRRRARCSGPICARMRQPLGATTVLPEPRSHASRPRVFEWKIRAACAAADLLLDGYVRRPLGVVRTADVLRRAPTQRRSSFRNAPARAPSRRQGAARDGDGDDDGARTASGNTPRPAARTAEVGNFGRIIRPPAVQTAAHTPVTARRAADPGRPCPRYR